jgi:hypothetical protein
VLLVNSAGNYADEHWTGVIYDQDGDGDLDFPWGSSYLPVHFGAGTSTIHLAWDEFGRCGHSDLDGWVYDQDGNIVGRAEGRQDPEGDSCAPVEHITVHAAQEDWYYLRIVPKYGDHVRVGIFARGGTVYNPQPGGLADPASNPSAFTVGAVRADGYAFNGAESFSSIGPTRGGFDKPDVAGPDGLSSRIYGPAGFFGTSAAAPAVAAAVALRMQAEPGISAREAADALAASTLDSSATWEAWDGALGAGRVRLPSLDAVGQACGGGGAAVVAPLLWWGRLRRRAACSR